MINRSATDRSQLGCRAPAQVFVMGLHLPVFVVALINFDSLVAKVPLSLMLLLIIRPLDIIHR